MRVSVETTEGLERRATIAVPSVQFEAEVAEHLKAAAETLKLPGFRPGKVPMKEVRRRLGPAARNEVAKNLAINNFSEAMRGQPFTLATQAEIEITNLAPGADLEFTATFDVLPDVPLVAFDSLQVRRPRATIEDADVDFTILELRRQRQEWVAVERPAQEGDRVVLEVVWKHGEDVVRTQEELALVLDEHIRYPQWKDALVGLAANDRGRLPNVVPAETAATAAEVPRDADAPLTLGEETAPAAVVDGLEEEDADTAAQTPGAAPASEPEGDEPASSIDGAEGEAAVAQADDDKTVPAAPAPADAEPPDEHELVGDFTVQSVEASVLPAIDDDLFDWFGVEKGEDRLAKFRAEVRGRMEVELQGAGRRATSKEALAVLVEAHEFDLPKKLVQIELLAELRRLAQVTDEIPPALAQIAAGAVQRRLRAQLVVREIVSRQSLTPDDRRVKERIDEIASAYEEPAQVRRAIYADEERTRQIEAAVLEEQVIEHVLSQAQVAAVDMPYRDLVAGKQLPERRQKTAQALETSTDRIQDVAAPATSAGATASEVAEQAENPGGLTPWRRPAQGRREGRLLGKVKRLLSKGR